VIDFIHRFEVHLRGCEGTFVNEVECRMHDKVVLAGYGV